MKNMILWTDLGAANKKSMPLHKLAFSEHPIELHNGLSNSIQVFHFKDITMQMGQRMAERGLAGI
jgi:hypothetical protein